MKIIKIASWDTLEGVAQAHALMQAIRARDPELVPELLVLNFVPEDKPSGFGVGLSALDMALLEGRADLYVTGLERVPVKLPPELPIVATGKREDPRCVLAVPFKRGIPNVFRPIGVSSSAELAQIAGIYPNWRAQLAAGSVMERLERLDKDEFGAMLLPASGLMQIRQPDRAYEIFTLSQILPPAGQGIIAVRGRAGKNLSVLSGFHDVDSWDMALAERAFMAVADTAPVMPAAVNAAIRDDKLVVHGMLADEKGKMWLGVLSGDREGAEQMGVTLAARLQLDAAGPKRARKYTN